MADKFKLRGHISEWWVLSEAHDAHFVDGWDFDFVEGRERVHAACGVDLSQALKQGFQAKGVVVSCECVQAFGACEACMVKIVRYLHFGEYNTRLNGFPCPEGHPCEIDKLHAKLIADGVLYE